MLLYRSKKDDNGVMIHCMKDSALMQKGIASYLYAMVKVRLGMQTIWMLIL